MRWKYQLEPFQQLSADVLLSILLRDACGQALVHSDIHGLCAPGTDQKFSNQPDSPLLTPTDVCLQGFMCLLHSWQQRPIFHTCLIKLTRPDCAHALQRNGPLSYTMVTTMVA